MVQGVIIKALSGFYYVAAGDQIVECKARGRFRYDGCSPLVGDRVQLSFDAHGKGRIEAVEQRRNAFIRPAVANIDQLIMIGAGGSGTNAQKLLRGRIGGVEARRDYAA